MGGEQWGRVRKAVGVNVNWWEGVFQNEEGVGTGE